MKEKVYGLFWTLTAVSLLSVSMARAEGVFSAAVEGVTMTQRENSRLVDIRYTLKNQAAIITLSIETNGVRIADEHVTLLTGDVSTLVQPGERAIVWDAGENWPGQKVDQAVARVSAWSVDDPPQYCAIDVSEGTDTTSYPIYYYPSAAAVPNGVAADVYKTTCILMRRISATGPEGFRMGSPEGESFRYHKDAYGTKWYNEEPHQVVLSKSYYIGVYEMTQCQWSLVMECPNGGEFQWPSKWHFLDDRLMRPVDCISYNRARDDYNYESKFTDWPLSHSVHTNSFMGRLRTKTGFEGFDLPTEAQWEYACRAGTTGALNDGTANLSGEKVDDQLGRLARYSGNSRLSEVPKNGEPQMSAEYGTAVVGSYLPNAWGLYDMHGNLAELCLDVHQHSLGTNKVTDPTGPVRAKTEEGGGNRFWYSIRGGSYASPARECRSASRTDSKRHWSVPTVGFRLVRNLP